MGSVLLNLREETVQNTLKKSFARSNALFLAEAMNIFEFCQMSLWVNTCHVHVEKDAQQVGDMSEMYFDIQPQPKGK